jgi:hypothetical protein
MQFAYQPFFTGRMAEDVALPLPESYPMALLHMARLSLG